MTKEQIVALLKDEAFARRFQPPCDDPDHTDQWCPSCENQEGGIRAYRRELLRRIEKEDEP